MASDLIPLLFEPFETSDRIDRSFSRVHRISPSAYRRGVAGAIRPIDGVAYSGDGWAAVARELGDGMGCPLGRVHHDRETIEVRAKRVQATPWTDGEKKTTRW